MNKRRRALFAVCCAALLTGGLACDPDTTPVLRGNSFSTTYWDMISTVRLAVETNGWNREPGQDLELSYTMDVEFSPLTKEIVRRNVKGVWVVWAGERLFDESGEYHQMVNALQSTYLTTTGLPIENNQAMLPSRKAGHFYGSPFDFADYVPFDDRVNVDRLHLTGHWRRPLDETVPPGLYRLTYDLFLDTAEMGTKQMASAPFLGGNNPQLLTANTFNPKAFMHFTRSLYPKRFLPMIQIGELKAQPRFPWVLFPKVHVNGNAGVVANEDKDRFGISSRYRYPNRMIMPPGKQQIYPCFLTNFPLAADFTDIGGAVLAQRDIEHYFDFTDGAASVSVQRPNGEVQPLGTRRFVGKREGGPLLEGGDYEYRFDVPGKYVVTMTGQIKDILGRSYVGGGSYDVYVGRWLTFSSTVKPGHNFNVGERYSPKVEVSPPCPADVAITIDYYPQSDRERKQTIVLEGKANAYGYFYPRTTAPTVVFPEPGEYRAETFASHVSPDGNSWFGSQTTAGVIVGPDSRVELHGVRSSDLGIVKMEEEDFGLKARRETHIEAAMGANFVDVTNCFDTLMPFYSGDVLEVTAPFSHNANVDAYLSMEPKDPELRAELAREFWPTPLLSLFVREDLEQRVDRLLRLNLLADVSYIVRDDEKGDMFPVLMRNRLGYQPFSFPESNDVEAYTYFSSLRPGLSTYAIVADSTAVGNYWSISPNHYGYQFNAGVNGDMANDLYLVDAGLVYKDRKRGRVDYSAYSATVLVRPKDANIIRILPPMQEPLFQINGRDIWIGLAMGTNEILEVGDSFSTGLIVFPTVPAEIEQTVEWPDGSRVERVSGVASRIGSFQGKVFTVDRPGVYRVATRAAYQGKTGTVFGSGTGWFNHYVTPTGKHDVLQIDLPPVSTYDAAKMLQIPLSLPDGYTNGKLTYSVVFPGMIMDEGEFPLEHNRRVFRFMPSQAAMQFPNFDVTDYLRGKPKLNDPVFFIFFVEATSPTGEKVYDAKKVMIRGDTIYYLGGPGSASGSKRPAGRSRH